MRKRLRRFFSEWAAKRAGRRPIDHTRMHRASRDIIGPTGYMLTRSVDVLGESGDAYLESFEDHMPPSLFVSKRDRTRLNQAVPLPERAIPDIVAGTADPDLDGYEEAFRQMDREAVERLIDPLPVPIRRAATTPSPHDRCLAAPRSPDSSCIPSDGDRSLESAGARRTVG